MFVQLDGFGGCWSRRGSGGRPGLCGTGEEERESDATKAVRPHMHRRRSEASCSSSERKNTAGYPPYLAYGVAQQNDSYLGSITRTYRNPDASGTVP